MGDWTTRYYKYNVYRIDANKSGCWTSKAITLCLLFNSTGLANNKNKMGKKAAKKSNRNNNLYISSNIWTLFHEDFTNVTRGPRSHDELRIVVGIVHATFQATCEALWLLGKWKVDWCLGLGGIMVNKWVIEAIVCHHYNVL